MGSHWQLLLAKVKNLGLFTMTDKATGVTHITHGRVKGV